MTAPNQLKRAWRQGRATLGLWLSMPHPPLAEVAGRLGYDYIAIDLQHGVADYRDVVGCLQALATSSSVPVVRVPWNEPGIIGKVLDAGAMGMIVPMVNTEAEANAAVRACRYPPAGARSYGPIRAGAVHGPDYFDGANAEVAVIPMIETAEAMANLDAILAVPGIDAVYVGPSDLSISFGLPPANDRDEPVFTESIHRVLAGCEARGVAAGIHCQPDLVAKRVEQGFAMVTVTSDVGALGEGAVRALRSVRTEG